MKPMFATGQNVLYEDALFDVIGVEWSDAIRNYLYFLAKDRDVLRVSESLLRPLPKHSPGDVVMHRGERVPVLSHQWNHYLSDYVYTLKRSLGIANACAHDIAPLGNTFVVEEE